jgi:hypothetical protein
MVKSSYERNVTQNEIMCEDAIYDQGILLSEKIISGKSQQL